MKNLHKTLIIPILIIAFSFNSCEEVIDIDLDEGKPRLVIDAGITWDKTTTGSNQSIVISKTSGYFNPFFPKVSGATVIVTNTDTDDSFTFNENPQIKGQYDCTNFIPITNNNYRLDVTIDNILYTAQEKLIPTPDINYKTIRQKAQQFQESVITEINMYFQDDPNQENFYLIGAKPKKQAVFEYSAFDDENSNGKEIKGIYFSNELGYFKENKDDSDEHVEIQFLGISKEYYEYLNIVLDVSQSGGNPFDTVASQSTLGNVVNTNNNLENPYGFFRLSEIVYDQTKYADIIETDDK